MKLTAIILTKNEEKNIERCLRSVDFCDEVIIVDDFSEDKTIYRIKKIFNPEGSRNPQDFQIFKRKLNGNFSNQRNFAMKKAKNEWVLFVDADEEVSDELKGETQKVIGNQLSVFSKNKKPTTDNRQQITAFRLKRRDFFWGRELKYGEIKKNRQVGLIRLIRKKSGIWLGHVHEEFRTNKTVGQLKSYLNHYPHQSVRDFLNDVNFYSSLRAKELYHQGRKTSIHEIIFYPLGKFLLTYIIKLGFLDGPAGFAYSFFMSFHSFLVRAKLFQYKRIGANSYAEKR